MAEGGKKRKRGKEDGKEVNMTKTVKKKSQVSERGRRTTERRTTERRTTERQNKAYTKHTHTVWLPMAPSHGRGSHTYMHTQTQTGPNASQILDMLRGIMGQPGSINRRGPTGVFASFSGSSSAGGRVSGSLADIMRRTMGQMDPEAFGPFGGMDDDSDYSDSDNFMSSDFPGAFLGMAGMGGLPASLAQHLAMARAAQGPPPRDFSSSSANDLSAGDAADNALEIDYSDDDDHDAAPPPARQAPRRPPLLIPRSHVDASGAVCIDSDDEGATIEGTTTTTTTTTTREERNEGGAKRARR